MDSKSKMAFKDLREPALIKSLAPDVREMRAGRLIGRVSSLFSRTRPDSEETYTGFKGQFYAEPAQHDGDKYIKEPFRASTLYCPDCLHEVLVAGLQDAEKAGGTYLEFAVDVYVQRANNPVGYQWFIRFLQEPSKDDPLAQLAARINGDAPALTHG